jgi:hypothetical protein
MFNLSVDKENLNGLYNELANSITENITNDDINSFVSLNIKKAWRTNIIVKKTRVSTS